MQIEYYPAFEENEHLYKVLIIGDIGTGKTSIIKKYVHNIFSEHYKSTIGVDFALKTIEKDGTTIRLQLWDIAGQERFSTMTRVYYRAAQAAIIVYDITKLESFKSINIWLENVRVSLGDNIPVIVFANKCDISKDYVTTELEKLCKEKNILKFFKTSAKTNIGIQEGMDYLIGVLISNNTKSPKKTNPKVTLQKNGFVKTIEANKQCCN